MEGLEISEVMKSWVIIGNEDFRVDSEFFKKEYLKLDTFLKNKKSNKIANFAKVSDGDHSKFPDNQSSEVRYLQAKDIKNHFIEDYNPVYISKSYFEKNRRSHVKEENIVLSIMGSVGDIAITPKGFTATLANRAVAIIRDIKEINPYYLFAYLSTKYGQLQIDRQKNGGVQERINLDVLAKVKILNISDAFQNKIENIVKKSHLTRDNSKHLHTQAEALLLKSLGLYHSPLEGTEIGSRSSNNSDLITLPLREGRFAMQNGEGSSFGVGNPDKADKFSHLSINQKSFKESFLKTGRLDAEYYQPKYEDYQNHIFSYSESWLPLEKVCNLKDKNYSPSDEKFYQYIELADINKNGGITGCSKELGKDLPSRARRKVNAGDVLISSIEGSLSSCAIVSKEFDNSLCSTGFYVIKSDKISSETLLVLFKSELMQNILKQSCSGTILTAINKDEFLKIPLPLIDPKTQSQISSLIQESFALKAKSFLKSLKKQLKWRLKSQKKRQLNLSKKILNPKSVTISNLSTNNKPNKINALGKESLIEIYQTKDGAIEFNADVKNQNIWSSQGQIVNLFKINQSVASRHIKNIFKDGEVDKSNMQKMHIANSDKPVAFYFLDVILAVGYLTNSKTAIEFRKWATQR